MAAPDYATSASQEKVMDGRASSDAGATTVTAKHLVFPDKVKSTCSFTAKVLSYTLLNGMLSESRP